MKSRIIALLLLMMAAIPLSAAQSSRFTLVETRTRSVSGPFTLYDGGRIRLNGILYTISSASDGRIAFLSPSGEVFGPYQPVKGRLMKIGDSMYSFDGTPRGARMETSHSGVASTVREAPIASFDPLPPKPEMIEIPPETPQKTVAPLDLPLLPDDSSPLIWSIWFAPIDRTPLKWKVESLEGSKSDFKRTSAGVGLSFNSWYAETAYSVSGKSGAIVPTGLGLSGASIEDASGFAIAAGYKRPFLREGGWIASAGIFGRYRQEKGDVSSTALVFTGEADTNELGNAISSFEKRTSSVKITETNLRLDFELGYKYEDFYTFATLLIQPVSSVKTTGTLPYGPNELSLEAKHDEAVGVMVGGKCDLQAGFYVSADLTLGFETRFRVALARDW